MNFRPLRAAAIAVAFLGVVTTGTAFAQTVGGFSRANVPVDNPFGAIAVDVNDLAPAASMVLVNSLSAAQLVELNDRCEVVIAGPFYYDRADAGFCQRVLDEQGLIPPSVAEGWTEPESSSSESSSSSSAE